MKILFIVILILIQCLVNAQAQDYKYFKVDTPFVGFVELNPLLNDNRVYNEKATAIYLNKEYRKYILQILKDLESLVPVDVWSKIKEQDKDKISFTIYFDKTGNIFRMNIIMPDDVFNHTTDEQWKKLCDLFKAINVLNYINVPDSEKNSFVYSVMSVRPYRYLKNDPEKLK